MQRTFKEIVREQIPPQIFMVIALVIILVTGYCVWVTAGSGYISVTVPLYRAEIYIDGSLVATSDQANQKMVFSFPEGRHDIIVSRSDYWPWTQTVELKKGVNPTLLPFLVPQKPNTVHLPAYVFDGANTTFDKDYLAKMEIFSALAIPESVAPLLPGTSIRDIRYADFFPGRTDVLIIAAGTKVFALDIVNTDPRNYEPIFEGVSPVFFKDTDNSLFVKDGDSLYRVTGLVSES